MAKIVIWCFALGGVLLSLGEASAKARRDKPAKALATDAAASPAATEAREAKAPRAKERAAAEALNPRASDLAASETKTPAATRPARGKLGKRKPEPKPPCFSPEVHVARRRGDVLEHRDLALTFCDGTPNPAAVESISVLGRPRNVERPLIPEIRAYQRTPVDRGPPSHRRRPEYLSEHVMRVQAELLPRLQEVATRFPGKTLEIVSGHRPDARETSRHHYGRALDIRVEGVSRESLRDFLRTLDRTGVGYYPNSYFVHMDVRDERSYWVDRSGPGEAADYGTWPPTRRDVERSTQRVVARAMKDLAALGESIALDGAGRTPTAVEFHDEPGEGQLAREEISRIRAQAMGIIEAL